MARVLIRKLRQNPSGRNGSILVMLKGRCLTSVYWLLKLGRHLSPALLLLVKWRGCYLPSLVKAGSVTGWGLACKKSG